jgi:hypothetical protein
MTILYNEILLPKKGIIYSLNYLARRTSRNYEKVCPKLDDNFGVNKNFCQRWFGFMVIYCTQVHHLFVILHLV